jgi:serine/threonine protein phosphatase PrpC
MWSIIQYLGYEGPLEIHSKSANYTEGDSLLLCSDGVSDNILGTKNNLSEIGDIVREARGDAKAIVKRAVEIGIKQDDISAVLVRL